MLTYIVFDTLNHSDPCALGVHKNSNSSMLGICLNIEPKSLEERFWSRRCHSRLNSLDVLYELCTTLIWLSILPMLEGNDRAFAKASLLLAVLQLVIIHAAPRLWISHRSTLLSSSLLLRCALLFLADSRSAAAAASPAQHKDQHSHIMETNLAASMTMAAGVWGNLLFVLFHQQPVRWQVPLLAVSLVLQLLSTCKPWLGSTNAGQPLLSNMSSISSIIGSCGDGPAAAGCGMLASLASDATGPDRELLGVSQALSWAFGLLAAGGINTDACLWQLLTPKRETSVLAAKLFVYGFGGFLLPAFIAYVVEWRYKVMFLLSACNLPQQQQLQVLTPAAAIVRASLLLSLLLYAGWLLMLATSAWMVCCAVASLLVVP